MREGIARIHKSGKPKSALQSILTKVTDPRKQNNYPTALEGYRRWWGDKTFEWLEPVSGKYTGSGFEVRVTPELGLECIGQRQLIKLYMSREELSPLKTDLIGALMNKVLAPLVSPDVAMGVLDVRRAKLTLANGDSAKLMPMVDGVLADIAAIWPSV